jgi:hypothetical protein
MGVRFMRYVAAKKPHPNILGAWKREQEEQDPSL